MKYSSWVKFPCVNQANDQIEKLKDPPKYATFGLSTKSNNIIVGMAQQQNLLEKLLLYFKTDQSLFTNLFNEITAKYKYLIKHLMIFLSEPLESNHKKYLVDSLQKYLDNSTQICELFYGNHIDSTVHMIDKVRKRYVQLNEISRWQKDEIFIKKVTHLSNQAIQLIHMINEVFTKAERIDNLLKHLLFFSCSTLQLKYISSFKGGHSQRIEAISTCVDQLDLVKDSINQISLHKLPPSVSIYSTISYVKTKLDDKNLKSEDLVLLSSKFSNLEEWMVSLETIHVDIKSNYEDMKQLLKSCQQRIEKNKFEWDEITIAVDSLELFLTKLKAEFMVSTGNTLKSTLFQFNTLIADSMKPNNQVVPFNKFKDLFTRLNELAGMMSLLAPDENHAKELLFSSDKVNFVSKQILFVIEHWFGLNCVKDCSFYHSMVNYLNSLWHQIYYKYLADLHLTIEFDDYFALLEDMYFSAAKETIRSISTGKADLFHSKSTSIATLLDYILCYARDKFLYDQKSDHSQVVLNKIHNFRNKFIKKFYRGILSIHHFMSSNPNVMLPENYLDKFERLCSNIQSELHDFTSLYSIHNLIHKMNNPMDKLSNKPFSNTVKLFVEQIYDNKTAANVISSKICINNTTCSIEYDPCVSFVVINEYGNAVLDVKTFQLEDTEILNFLKHLTPNTLLVASIINPANTKVPEHLINYFTLVDCHILSKFQKKSTASTEDDDSNMELDGAILVGYVSTHRFIAWHHIQSSVISSQKSSHVYSANIPTSLAYKKVLKVEVRQHDSSSSSSMGLQAFNNSTPTFNSMITINGVEYMKSMGNMFTENTTNSTVGCGYCYVFEDMQNPHYGNLVQVKVTEIEDFVGGLNIGSVCCFVFPHGIGESIENIVQLFNVTAEDLNANDNFSAIFINRESKKKGDNFRYVKVVPTTPMHLTQYINTNLTNESSTLFVDNAIPNENVVCVRESQNIIQNLIKKMKKQDGDKINKLNKEFDQLQSDFLSHLRKSSLINTHDTSQSDKNGHATIDDPVFNDNSVLALAKKICFLISYIVDITRSEGLLVTDQDIINNCREIKRVGECMITLCTKISNQCQKGPTRSEITSLMEELPLFLQQLLVISKVNYGSVYSRFKDKKEDIDATQMASSLIISSSNILKTVINLLKLMHSAKVQYKLNIDINPPNKSGNNATTFISALKNLQNSIQKPSTL